MDNKSKYRKIFVIAVAVLAVVVLILFATGKLDDFFAADLPIDSDYSANRSLTDTYDDSKSGSSDNIDDSTSDIESSSSESSSSSDNESSSSSTQSSSSENSSASSSNSKPESSSNSSSTSSPAASQLKFRNKNLLNQHYEKHGKDMGFSSAEEYEKAAARVPYDPDVLHKIEKEDGDDVYYIERTNEFVIVSTDGYLRTYFNPDRGIDYFNRQ